MAPFSRRVDEDDVGIDPFADELLHDLLGFAEVVLRIVHTVELRILLRVFDCGLDDFDADDLPGTVGCAQTNRADAAVRIDDGFITLEVGEFDGLLVQLFRLGMVDLIEGFRADAEVLAEQRVGDIVLAAECDGPLPEDDIGLLVIDVLDDTGDHGEGFNHLFDDV